MQTKDSLLCQKCNPNRQKKKNPSNLVFEDTVKLPAAALSYSFIAFALLSIFTSVVMDLGLNSIAAALLGVAVSEGVNKVVVRVGGRTKMALIFLGVFAGAVLGFGMKYVVQGQLALALASLIPASIWLLIVVLAIYYRVDR